MYNTTQAPATVTITLTQEQYAIFTYAMNEAKSASYRIADWTGETAEVIEARYAIP